MKRVLLATAAVVASGFALPALAADLPVKAPIAVPHVFDWSGFYVGVNGGWGSGRKDWTSLGDSLPVAAGPEGSHDASGWLLGLQLGYNWQVGSWVFGLEAQGGYADLQGSNVSPITGLTDRSRIGGFGLFTGRVGYAWDTALLYVKGGGAIVSDQYDTLQAGTIFETASGSRWGGVAGVGFEYGVVPNWSFGIEYDHLFVGRTQDVALNFTSGFGGGFSRTDRINSRDVDLVLARVSHHWKY
jgi:outer membrane immunogenic protein